MIDGEFSGADTEGVAEPVIRYPFGVGECLLFQLFGWVDTIDVAQFTGFLGSHEPVLEQDFLSFLWSDFPRRCEILKMRG
jgi:hypothetical protein